MSIKYRDLTSDEVLLMERAGCSAADWSRVKAGSGFDAKFIKNSSFSGDVLIGATGSEVEIQGGVVKFSGIYNAAIYNSEIGDNVLINNVYRYISNYIIDDNAVVENVGVMACEGESSFGNGVEVATINEAGGREVPMYDSLTAPVAYMVAMYRHKTEFIEKIKVLVEEYSRSVRSNKGLIGKHATVVSTKTLINVRIGDYATIDGVSSLTNGTVNSSQVAPSYVGANVIASDFIFSPYSKVDTGAMIRESFVGEGVILENGFSVEKSLFFANSHCAHGEACAAFAGPFTVTHHRSTLLIAGMFSFFNAGSGANQSNHLYKTGPVHQGIHQRGCKFGSDAYVLLPVRTGAFSIVSGRHYSHYDTEDMPFSYLVYEDGHSWLVPAANLRSYGRQRDALKWPKRDRRKGVRRDLINFEIFNPAIAMKMIRAVEVSEALLAKYPTADVVTWNRVKIKSIMLRRGISIYKQAIMAYLSSLLKADLDPIVKNQQVDVSQWSDLSGLVAPRSEVAAIMNAVETGDIATLDALDEALSIVHDNYPMYASLWAVEAVRSLTGKSALEMTPQELAEFIAKGDKESTELQAHVEASAMADKSLVMSTGYGVDSEDPQIREQDFKAVRG